MNKRKLFYAALLGISFYVFWMAGRAGSYTAGHLAMACILISVVLYIVEASKEPSRE